MKDTIFITLIVFILADKISFNGYYLNFFDIVLGGYDRTKNAVVYDNKLARIPETLKFEGKCFIHFEKEVDLTNEIPKKFQLFYYAYNNSNLSAEKTEGENKENEINFMNCNGWIEEYEEGTQNKDCIIPNESDEKYINYGFYFKKIIDNKGNLGEFSQEDIKDLRDLLSGRFYIYKNDKTLNYTTGEISSNCLIWDESKKEYKKVEQSNQVCYSSKFKNFDTNKKNIIIKIDNSEYLNHFNINVIFNGERNKTFDIETKTIDEEVGKYDYFEVNFVKKDNREIKKEEKNFLKSIITKTKEEINSDFGGLEEDRQSYLSIKEIFIFVLALCLL